MLQVSKAKSFGCRNCGKAAQLLKERASRFHSKLLATAGETLAGKAPGKDAKDGKSLSLASAKNQLAMGAAGSAGCIGAETQGLVRQGTVVDERPEAAPRGLG